MMQVLKCPVFLFCFLVLLFSGSRPAFGQVSIADSAISLAWFEIAYSGGVTAGDMSDRFGFTSTIGANVAWKFRSNFYLTAGASYLFGGKVKEDSIINNILIPGGLLIADDGSITEPRIHQSGIVVPIMFGKIFPIFNKLNPNSGLYVEVGPQFIQHKIQVTGFGGNVAALSNTYRKGYDRMTNGIGFRERVGLRYFSSNTLVNFSIGLDLSQNLTQSRRSVNFDTGLRDDKKRLDLLSGFSVSWTYPLYRQAPERTYFY